MALQCELCGGRLVMNAGGKSAVCGACGLEYPLARLRELLGAAPAEPPAAVPAQAKGPQQPKEKPAAQDEHFARVMQLAGAYLKDLDAENIPELEAAFGRTLDCLQAAESLHPAPVYGVGGAHALALALYYVEDRFEPETARGYAVRSTQFCARYLADMEGAGDAEAQATARRWLDSARILHAYCLYQDEETDMALAVLAETAAGPISMALGGAILARNAYERDAERACAAYEVLTAMDKSFDGKKIRNKYEQDILRLGYSLLSQLLTDGYELDASVPQDVPRALELLKKAHAALSDPEQRGWLEEDMRTCERWLAEHRAQGADAALSRHFETVADAARRCIAAIDAGEEADEPAAVLRELQGATARYMLDNAADRATLTMPPHLHFTNVLAAYQAYALALYDVEFAGDTDTVRQNAAQAEAALAAYFTHPDYAPNLLRLANSLLPQARQLRIFCQICTGEGGSDGRTPQKNLALLEQMSPTPLVLAQKAHMLLAMGRMKQAEETLYKLNGMLAAGGRYLYAYQQEQLLMAATALAHVYMDNDRLGLPHGTMEIPLRTRASNAIAALQNCRAWQETDWAVEEIDRNIAELRRYL